MNDTVNNKYLTHPYSLVTDSSARLYDSKIKIIEANWMKQNMSEPHSNTDYFLIHTRHSEYDKRFITNIKMGKRYYI